MPQYEEKYDPDRISFIKTRLQREASKGRARDFEIFVDGFKVVPRTNEVEDFDEFEDALREGTRSISILLFDGPGTNRNTKHIFTFPSGNGTQEQKSALGDLDGIIAQKIADRDKDHELSRLRGVVENLEEQLAEAEQYSEELQNKILQIEADGKNRMLKLGDVGATILMGVLRNSAQGSAGKALAGLLGVDDVPLNPTPAENASIDGHVSYHRQSNPDIDDTTQSRIALLESMQRRLNEPQMLGAIHILGQLADSPHRIPEVLQFLEPETIPHE